MKRDAIEERLARNGIPFAEELPRKLETWLSLLMEWNGRMDLVAEAPEEELFDRHMIDSLTVLKTGLLPRAGSLIDVGTGAGFPGMALALARPDLRVTLLDSQQKRLNILRETAEKTGAENVTLVHARAEDAARKPELREGFDAAVARAVAPLNILCEYLLPFVKVGGYALCWKGPAAGEEAEDGAFAAEKLGGRLEPFIEMPQQGTRHVLVPVFKIEKTLPQYPRKNGIPAKRPLKSGKK